MINLPKLIAVAIVAGLALPTFAEFHHHPSKQSRANMAVIAKGSPARPEQRPLTRIKIPVNINTATVRILEQVEGISTQQAEAMIAYRDHHGKFKTVQDLAQVQGVGLKQIEQLKKSLAVG